MSEQRFYTLGLHGGSRPSAKTANASKSPPIFQTTVFTFDGIDRVEEYLEGDPDLYMYSRLGNPNQRDLEARLAAVEGAEAAAVTSSGMSAILVAVLSMAELRRTRRLVVSDRLYGGTRTLFLKEFAPMGFEIVEVDLSDPAAVDAALSPSPAILYFETISNPSMSVAPVEELVIAAGKHGAAVLIDNTFLSPVLFRPLEWGAHAVVHSSTKYLNGHSDATGGAVLGEAGFIADVRRRTAALGCHLNPFEAWLTLRGLQTLALRMDRHCANGMRIARALAGGVLGRVGDVSYPLLESGGAYRRNRKLFPDGCGGMLSFNAGDEDRARRFIEGCELISFSPSLAGVQTTLSHPATTSHRGQSDEELARQGIGRGTIRLSVGIEDPADIEGDLRHALAGM
jgi:cystathionine beta-lyase/cystathionine gamma-synthase